MYVLEREMGIEHRPGSSASGGRECCTRWRAPPGPRARLLPVASVLWLRAAGLLRTWLQ